MKGINWRRLSFHEAAKQWTPFNARQLDSAECVPFCTVAEVRVTKLKQPHGLIPLYQNQSWKVKTVVLKWMIMKGWNSECWGPWTSRRYRYRSNAVSCSVNFICVADSDTVGICNAMRFLCCGLWVWLQTMQCLFYIQACVHLQLKVLRRLYRIGSCMTVQMTTDFCSHSPLYPQSEVRVQCPLKPFGGWSFLSSCALVSCFWDMLVDCDHHLQMSL